MTHRHAPAAVLAALVAVALAACGGSRPTHELVFAVEQPEAELADVVEVVAERLVESGGTAEALPGDPARVLCRVHAEDHVALLEIVEHITEHGTFEFRICASDAEEQSERRRRDEQGFRYKPIDATRVWVPDVHARYGMPDRLLIVPEAPLLAELSELEGEQAPEATERVRALREELARVRAEEVFGAADVGQARLDRSSDEGDFVGRVVLFEIRPERAAAFEEFTRRNVQRQVAMVLDGAVETAPRIVHALPGRGVIESGGVAGFRDAEAQHLVRVLTTTPLPARLTLVSTKRLGD